MKKGIYVPLSCAILTVAALSGCSTTNKIPNARPVFFDRRTQQVKE